MKNVDPNTPVESLRLSSEYAWPYSYACRIRNRIPSMIVSDRPKIRLPRSPFLSAQCAHVTVTPEDSSSSVLIAGMPNACIGENSGGRYGPAVGQCAPQSGH